MRDHTILLVCSDASFVDIVRAGLAARQACRLIVIETPEEAARLIGWHSVRLVVVYLDKVLKNRSVARLIWVAAACSHRIPILAVGERYEPERAMAMFRLGVSDYLSRVDHLCEIAPLIDSLGAGGREDAGRGVDNATGPFIRFDRRTFSTS